MRFLGVLLNSTHDGLDGRYSPQRDDLEDFSEELDVLDRIGPDPEPEGD